MLENKDRLLFLDTETTGRDSKDRLLSIAYKCDKAEVHGLFKPPIPINLEAMAVHHVTEKMVADKLPFRGSHAWRELKELVEEEDYILVAHNAAFDVDMLAKEEVVPKRVICTMKIARALDEHNQIPNYKMQYLRHYFGIEVNSYAHSADGDIVVLRAIFDILQKNMSIPDMIDVTGKPFLLRTLPFGKYYGVPFKDIPRDYLDWLKRNKTDMEGDLAYTVDYYLYNRGNAA